MTIKKVSGCCRAIWTGFSKADSVDAAINMILIEEMPAYFAGQKTLEQVIPVMQNRIQKVLDERK